MITTLSRHQGALATRRTRSSLLRRTALACAILMLGGCAGQGARMSPTDRQSLSVEPSIVVLHHKARTVFTYASTGYSAASALLSPLVAVAQVNEGMALEKEFKLEDPVLRIQARLVRALQEELHVTAVMVVPEAPGSDEIPNLLKAYPGAVVLDVRTTKWGIDNNRAIHEARARLLRTSRRSDLLWQGDCAYTADKDKPSPKDGELKANGGALLKAKVMEAADGCAEQLVGWIAKDR